MSELQIVKVRYIFQNGRGQSAREYTYYSVDRLKVGDHVSVPVRDTFDVAMVTAIDLPPASVEAFKDKVKVIAHDSTVAPRRPTVASEKSLPGSAAEQDVLTRLANPAGPYDNQLWPAADAQPAKPPEAGPYPPGNNDGEQNEEGQDNTALIMIKPDQDAAARALYMEGAHLLELARARTIKSDADAQLAVDDLAVIGSITKKLAELRRQYEAPIKKHLADFKTAFDTFVAPLVEAERVNKDKWGAYRKAIEAAAARAAETNRMAEEVARRQAEASGTGEVTVNTTPVEAPKTADTLRANVGTGVTYKTPKYEVMDFAALPDRYKMVDAAKLTREIKAAKGDIVIAGVRIYFDDVLTVRPKGG